MDNSKCVIFSDSNDDLEKASNFIQKEKLVIFPTETVYGLGANALSTNAVKKIFKFKKRPEKNPLIVHCLGIYDSKSLSKLNKI